MQSHGKVQTRWGEREKHHNSPKKLPVLLAGVKGTKAAYSVNPTMLIYSDNYSNSKNARQEFQP